MRARTYLGDIEPNVAASLKALREKHGDASDADLVVIETFAAVAMRVMKKTNPGKVRDEARTVEIGMLMRAKEGA